jgi:hypothetical protein
MFKQLGSKNDALEKYFKENYAFFCSKVGILLKYTLNLTNIHVESNGYKDIFALSASKFPSRTFYTFKHV